MICVSIGRGRHKQMMAEHRHLAEQGAELVELRLDYIRRAVNLKRLLQNRPCPVVATCRRAQDGGQWEGTEEARQVLLRQAIVDGVDYVDLEEDIAGNVPRYGDTKRIISYHNFEETPENLAEIYTRMAAQDADIIKIATMAHSTTDNMRVLDIMRGSEAPAIGVCMGDIGAPTRILAGKFGAPFTYATFSNERSLAPGQLSYRQMTNIYDYDNITPKTDVFGVIADPVGHSLSPIVHNAAFRELKLDKTYVPFRVPREDLGTFLGQCRDLGVRGLSVTIPHKEEVVNYLDESDEFVQGIGACNTIVFDDDGRLHGYNTDCDSAVGSLIATIGKNNVAGRTALVLGSGGAAKAISYGLKSQGADVTISGRNVEKSRELAVQLECDILDWSDRHTAKCSLLVNCTPVGMHPNVEETPFNQNYLHRTTIVFDTVYNPEQTLLIKQARAQQCRTITGVEMFVRQAALQFKLFTDADAPLDLMHQQVKRVIGAAQP
ncbi:MAG: shikimate dehydrogenase [Pirellulaceae bacterium]|nr:shikimate dehydrogenase [Pirellulaceae bacterium]MDP7017461.1 shikimate dehydrogenase [Pirellulaceae bacterium]